ncbi:MAG: hypothetical protein JWN04_765 [Myxococcaceae bacterium]|nr:hypothetical protein [Myxococcaceae bacterium]
MTGAPQSLHANYEHRIYANAGNPAVVSMIDPAAVTILDIGCGAGDNAALIKASNPSREIFGITASPSEAVLASRWMTECCVADLESEFPGAIIQRSYDAILCSHVLEHLRNPASVVERLAALLKPGGSIVIAVPNVLFWRQRANFFLGRFEYEASGTMDETHLRFFTYYTAAAYLLARAPTLQLEERRVSGSVPLWLLRRRVLSSSASLAIDRVGMKWVPNLFGGEILLRAVRRG